MNNIGAVMSMLNPPKKVEVPEDNTIKIGEVSYTTTLFGSSYSLDKFMDSYEQVDETLPLTVEIDSNGGSISTFIQIAYVLSEYPSKIIVNIKRRACSGAALLAILGDEIRMNKFSTMGAFNPYMFIPITSRDIQKAQRSLGYDRYGDNEKPWGYSYFDVFIEYFKNVETQYSRRVQKLLAKKYSEKDIETILEFFMYQHEHSFPIYHHMLPECIQKKVSLEGLKRKPTEIQSPPKELKKEKEETPKAKKPLVSPKPLGECKREILFKLDMLKKRYRDLDIPALTIKDSYNAMKEAYDKALKEGEQIEKQNKTKFYDEAFERIMF